MRVEVLMGMLAALAGCAARPADVCRADDTRAALLQDLDASGLWPRGTLETDWEITLSDVAVEGVDLQAGRTECSAEIYVNRIGSPQGYAAGRHAYLVHARADGPPKVAFYGTPEDMVGLMVAGRAAARSSE